MLNVMCELPFSLNDIVKRMNVCVQSLVIFRGEGGNN